MFRSAGVDSKSAASEERRKAPTIYYANDIINPTMVKSLRVYCWKNAHRQWVEHKKCFAQHFCIFFVAFFLFSIEEANIFVCHSRMKLTDARNVVTKSARTFPTPIANLQQWRFNFDWWLHLAISCSPNSQKRQHFFVFIFNCAQRMFQLWKLIKRILRDISYAY